jgi:hypothetical protein
MVSGDRAGISLENRWGYGNLVRLRISATSQFRRTSSPSFSPDARCVHTKHRLVDAAVALPCSVRLIEMDPCHRSNISCQQQLI